LFFFKNQKNHHFGGSGARGNSLDFREFLC
jgi:hypothetical protein